MRFGQLKRRELISLLGGAAAAWPLTARAQIRQPTLGFLGADAAAWSLWTAAFVERLRALGWVDGRSIAIEYRWSEGSPERVNEVAAEFIRMKVDVIVASGSAVPAVKQMTAAIPIVFPVAADPVGTGVVASLARPGGNVTGLSVQQSDLAGKRLELLREVVPHLRRLAILAHVGLPDTVLEIAEVQAAARALSVDVTTLEIRQAQDIGSAFEAP